MAIFGFTRRHHERTRKPESSGTSSFLEVSIDELERSSGMTSNSELKTSSDNTCSDLKSSNSESTTDCRIQLEPASEGSATNSGSNCRDTIAGNSTSGCKDTISDGLPVMLDDSTLDHSRCSCAVDDILSDPIILKTPFTLEQYLKHNIEPLKMLDLTSPFGSKKNSEQTMNLEQFDSNPDGYQETCNDRELMDSDTQPDSDILSVDTLSSNDTENSYDQALEIIDGQIDERRKFWRGVRSVMLRGGVTLAIFGLGRMSVGLL